MRSTEQLVAFLNDSMSMTDVYQPAIILHLLESGGSASKHDLARVLCGYDQSVQEYYERVLMRWPKSTLTKHSIVGYDRRKKEFVLDCEMSDTAGVTEAKRICQKKIGEWIKKRDGREPSSDASASNRFMVIKASGGRCELCGISSKLSPIDIDHIVPRSHADKHGCIVKDGVRMTLDDKRNLQALCFRCNRAKRDKDTTDFRAPPQKLVRDRIPEIIGASGRTAVTKTLEGRELVGRLFEKLLEEHTELLASESVDEVADMIEVLLAIASQLGHSEEAVFERQRLKREERGGFTRGMFLTNILPAPT